jgi:hypothetical protein
LLLRKAQFFFLQNTTLGYMTKTLNQIIFFSNIGNQNIFLEKNHNPPFINEIMTGTTSIGMLI